MDYTRNEDYYFQNNQQRATNFNSIIDVQFVEGSFAPDEPVTIEEAKAQAIIDDSIPDDTLIQSYITTARQQCEAYIGLSFLQREIQAIVNNSLGNIYLPYGPIQEVLSIYGEDDVEIKSDSYKILGLGFKQIKYPMRNYLKVTYMAGYSELPQVFKTAILQQVAYLYENRGYENVIESTNTKSMSYNLSTVAKQLLLPYRRVS